MHIKVCPNAQNIIPIKVYIKSHMATAIWPSNINKG